MFFDDVKKGGGIASAILTSSKSGDLVNKPAEEGPRDHELLVHELHDAVHNRDVMGTYHALHALHLHFAAKAAEPE